ncbi:MAG TPA: transaldolase, partial [Armatimonadota bacterium]
YQPLVDDALAAMTEQSFARRLWEKDASLWRQGPAGEKLIRKRLGWLDVVEVMCGCTKEITDFAQEIIHSGFTNAVLIGMGGSSLSPEVSLQMLHQQKGYPKFHVIDSTVPGEVLRVADSIDIAKTLFIVSSKSGMTIETLAAYRYFLEKVSSLKGKNAANNFIAITDSGSPLEAEALERGFRRIFLNPPDIGGRYSALSYFGLVPAAVFGADIDRLLERASRMAESCAPCVSPDSNPGIILGATMGELGLKGRDKVTIIAPPEIVGFEDWAEQLIAESTGKQGTGLVPITREPLMSPDCYGEDRQFIYLRKTGSENAEMDDKVRALEHAGHPVVLIHLDDEYDLGQEYFRWETAVASVGALLGIDAFDEPNVQESKDDTARILGEYLRTEKLDEFKTAAESDGLALLCDSETKAALDGIRSVQMNTDASVYSYIAAHLANFQPGNYFALTAFLQASSKIESIVSELRAELMSGFKAATTFNYGPRFLHSTGQLHKSGPNSGIFIQLTADDPEDVSIPGVRYSYSLLKQAQALGDGISLRSKGRPFIRLHLGDDISGNLDRILQMVKRAMEENKR